MNKEKLNSLQVLRALAFLGIFTSHSRLNSCFGAWGVSIFFILSGFLMFYQYSDKDLSYTIKDSLLFSLSKIKKLYLLHVIMTFVAIPYQLFIIGKLYNFNLILELILKFILNLTLLQTWSPFYSYYGSFNGVSWFLSVCMFLYFVFPFCLMFEKKLNKISYIMIAILITYVAQILFAFLTRNICFDMDSSWGNYYFAYTFPVFRLGDFFIGCCLGNIFSIEKKHKIEYSTVYEICVVIIIFLSGYYYTKGIKWFRLDLLWTVSSVPLIYLMANDGGYITKILHNKFFIFIGNLSGNSFLIHEMVILYVSII